MAQRPFNLSKSNDHDYVPPDRSERPRKGEKLSDFDPLLQTTDFEPLSIPDREGSITIPEGLNASDPAALFSFCFNDECIERLVICTNRNAERDREGKTVSRSRNKQSQMKENHSFRPESWRPVTKSDILTYIGIDLYMGLYPEAQQSDYWQRSRIVGPSHEKVYEAMARNRYQQIHRYFHVWHQIFDHSDQSKATMGPRQKPKAHQKVSFISERIRSALQTLWVPGSDLAIDESIEAFTVGHLIR